MSANKHLTALAISTALVIGQSALAQEPAGDSAYQWGRWAVLSPASGGEPFSGPDEPGADFNVRPGDLFSPELASSGGSLPPVTLSGCIATDRGWQRASDNDYTQSTKYTASNRGWETALVFPCGWYF